MMGKQLSLFLAVYGTNSINRAAEQLGLSQSTVSYSFERLREIDPAKETVPVATAPNIVETIPGCRAIAGGQSAAAFRSNLLITVW